MKLGDNDVSYDNRKSIVWSAIYNATVVRPWCDVKKGIIPKLKQTRLASDFDKFNSDVRKVQNVQVALTKDLKLRAEIPDGRLLPEGDD